ncbi:beta subunit of N-acylethanolamine-hydrolyzing acid amidase-domain-containing protein [Roridomyces roridus]|uniref:ceramidase n=1 Tax=Roridomyces roridus TaxID=1738132 RepID=A0AAD7BKK9_9AGAR|nr:beta subunit of N-acylethanolamine-hydrolyzing acid amidase-domain-containing protein [Roridomyces roridus]
MPPTTRSQTRETTKSNPWDPPTYHVDLSAPPEDRYTHICADFKDRLSDILPIYYELLDLTPAPKLLDFLARTLLRRVNSAEETREIRGIARHTGIPLHLVVAFNTFLDLFSGCSSGGIRVCDAGTGSDSGIVHFRALDWGMEPLRKLIICIDYVRDGQTVARTVTYAGYIGVLTGVRSGLSISLNYRNVLAMGSKAPIRSHRFHQIAVLLGFRAAIPSVLRRILLSPDPPPELATLARDLRRKPTTPCYLTFCTPSSILILEKDLITAVLGNSSDFLAVTNHDASMEALTPDAFRALLESRGLLNDTIIPDSIERKQCVSLPWADKGRRLKIADVARQMEVRPVLNEQTHFSCLLDPAVEGGGLLWVRAYEESAGPDYSDVVSSDPESD